MLGGPSLAAEEGQSTVAQDRMSEQFSYLREEMVLFGLRPNAASYAAMCEGYIKLGAADQVREVLSVLGCWGT